MVNKYYMFCLALSIGAFSCATSAQKIVYDNTSTPVSGQHLSGGTYPFSFYADGETTGEAVTLAGTERKIVQFDLLLAAGEATTIDSLTLRFWAMDGEYADDVDNPIWESDPVLGLELTETPPDQPHVLSIPVPNVFVPDTFIWGVTADSDVAGLVTYDPPTVGSSEDGFWNVDSDGNQYTLWLGADPVTNFGARIHTPEPATLATLAFGALLAPRNGRRGRRRRAP